MPAFAGMTMEARGQRASRNDGHCPGYGVNSTGKRSNAAIGSERDLVVHIATAPAAAARHRRLARGRRPGRAEISVAFGAIIAAAAAATAAVEHGEGRV